MTRERRPFVVCGATGQTGVAVIDTLLAAEQPVRAIVRDPRQIDRFEKRGASAVVADLNDSGAVYVLNPPAYREPDLFTRAETIAAACIQALDAAGRPKTGVLSSIGAQSQGDPRPITPPAGEP